ncbi:MAG: UDP-N-acetylmuramate--alanine ligase [Acidimicrobiaceae bacterium]
MIDLTTPLAIHVVGVGGAGMSAIASVLARMGHRVSGSDLKDSAALRRLEAQGVIVHVGHAAANVADADLVAVSTAIAATNPEVVAASAAGAIVMRRAEILAAIAATRRTLAVSGTHGKTTTSSMLALILLEAGLRPSYIVGGELNETGSGASWSDGDLFVVEADESDGTFVELPAAIAVVTNVEADHLDHYGTFAAIEREFERFLRQAPGPNVVCADEPTAARLGRETGALLYGTDAAADYRIVEARTERAGAEFTLVHEGADLGRIRLPVPGMHNVRNAAAATVAALQVGAPFAACRAALARYAGVARRFQFRGTVADPKGGLPITFVDDYAHNPGKVHAVLAAAKGGHWSRVVCVFQPHRFSRTADLAEAFGTAFGDADVIVVMDVYAAGEAPRPGVTGKLIVDSILLHRPWARVAWLPKREDVIAYLRSELRPGDLCLTVGAGDITSLADDVIAVLA